MKEFLKYVKDNSKNFWRLGHLLLLFVYLIFTIKYFVIGEILLFLMMLNILIWCGLLFVGDFVSAKWEKLAKDQAIKIMNLQSERAKYEQMEETND